LQYIIINDKYVQWVTTISTLPTGINRLPLAAGGDLLIGAQLLDFINFMATGFEKAPPSNAITNAIVRVPY
jgi:hypothetical protein